MFFFSLPLSLASPVTHLSGASVDCDSKDRAMLYTLHGLQEPSEPADDCEKMSNMGTLNSSQLHHSTNSLNLDTELEHCQRAVEEQEEEEVAMVMRGGAAGGVLSLSSHQEDLSPSLLHAPALRRSRSASRPPQMVKFSEDTVDNGCYGGIEVDVRQHPMSERPQRRMYRLDEPGRERGRPASHHGHSRQHHHPGRHHRSRKARSDNALHMVPSERAQRPFEAQQPQGLVDPQGGALFAQPSSHRLPLVYPQTRSDYGLQSVAQGDPRVERFMGLYRDEDDWCSTCSSSSSDSEEEGYFLGQPIPQPRPASRYQYYAEDYPTRVTALSSQAHGSRTSRRKSHRAKNCIIS